MPMKSPIAHLPGHQLVLGEHDSGEPGDQGAVQVEERADPRSGWAGFDLGDRSRQSHVIRRGHECSDPLVARSAAKDAGTDRGGGSPASASTSSNPCCRHRANSSLIGDRGAVVADGDGAVTAARHQDGHHRDPGSGPIPYWRSTFAPAMNVSPGYTGTLLAWMSAESREPVIDSSTASGSNDTTGATAPITSMAASSRRCVICARIFRIRATGSVPIGAARLTPVNRLPPAGSDADRRLTGTARGSARWAPRVPRGTGRALRRARRGRRR